MLHSPLLSHRIGLVDASGRQDYAPVVKSGYHLRFPTSYPGFKSRRAHHSAQFINPLSVVRSCYSVRNWVLS